MQNQDTTINRYQRMFPEHQMRSQLLKLAANTGQISKLEKRLKEAVKHGTPILDWSEFIPHYARTSAQQAASVRYVMKNHSEPVVQLWCG